MSSFQCHRQADRFLGFPPVPFPFYWPDLYSCNPAFNLHLEGFVYLIVIYYGFTVLSQKSLYVCLETQCLFIVLRRLSHVVRLHVCAHSFKGIPFFFLFCFTFKTLCHKLWIQLFQTAKEVKGGLTTLLEPKKVQVKRLPGARKKLNSKRKKKQMRFFFFFFFFTEDLGEKDMIQRRWASWVFSHDRSCSKDLLRSVCNYG